MKIFLGADHNGFEYKQQLSKALQLAGHEIVDEGDETLNAQDDYPQFAGKVATALLASGDPEARGILVCGSGQGMANIRCRKYSTSTCCNGYGKR